MPDHLPRAVQSFVRPGIVRRQASCPTHSRQTSQFLGPQWVEGKTLWRFRCAGRDGHDFFALPDRTAPKTPEEAAQWEKEIRAVQAGLDKSYDAGGR